VKRFREGEILCRQGETADSLIFIESGRVGVLVEAPDARATRVRVYSRQTIVGELGFFLNTPRIATVRVEQEASAGFLDRTTFQRLSAERPAVTLALLSYIARVQAERLTFATRQMVSLRRH
jgi:SulP family sulfate permease